MRGQPHILPLLVQTQSPVAAECVHAQGAGSQLGPVGVGGSGEVVQCLSGLVGLEDMGGMLQVSLGQPEVVLWAIALEQYQILVSCMDRPVGG